MQITVQEWAEMGKKQANPTLGQERGNFKKEKWSIRIKCSREVREDTAGTEEIGLSSSSSRERLTDC